MGKRTKIFNLMGEIVKESETSEVYNTGLLGEHIIVASYKKMSLSDLEKLRFIINKIIKKKKEFRRVEESKLKK